MQFNRDYQLTITYDGIDVVIQPPMRVTFDIYKSIDGSGLNKGTIEIYNLKESTRLKLVKDAEETKIIRVKLIAGYAGQMRQIYSGTVFKGKNSRNSNVDIVTHLESIDGWTDLSQGFINKTVIGKGRALEQALSDLETNKGAVTRLTELTRPKVMVGRTSKVIDSFLEDGQTWFIDDGKLNIITETETISGFIPVISAESGLISTPTRQMTIIDLETRINPAIYLGGQIKLISTTAPHLNGIHKVVTMNTKGDYDGNDWTAAIKLRAGTYEAIS